MADEPTAEEKAATEAAASAAQAETVKAVANAVRESLGFKEGERFDEKIRGAAASSVNHALGLEEGQTVKSMFTDMLEAQKPADTKGATEKEIAAAQLKAVEESVGGIKQQLTEAQAAVASEKRSGYIRDSLDKFPVDDAFKDVLLRGFLHGAEANPVLTQDGSGVEVKSGDGRSVDFDTYLGQYFEAKKQFLKEEKNLGTGAKGADGKPPANGAFVYDYKKHMEDGGKALREEAAKNPDGAAERQEAVGKVNNAKVDAFFGRK